MNSDPDAEPSENFFQRALHSAPGRAVVLLMAILAGILTAYILAALVTGLFPPNSLASAALEMLILVIVTTGFYLGGARLFERRSLPVEELSRPGAGRELGAGLLIGAVLALLSIGGLWLLGVYRPGGWNGLVGLIPALTSSLPSGYLEELALRGVILRIGEEKMGAFTALLVSALVPGLLYAAGNGSTPLGILSAALVTGALMGTAYLLTHRLWMPIGIHAAWDFVLDGIFGTGAATTPSLPARGLFQAVLDGPALLTGGEASVETSIVTLVIAGIACAVLYWMAGKRSPDLIS